MHFAVCIFQVYFLYLCCFSDFSPSPFFISISRSFPLRYTSHTSAGLSLVVGIVVSSRNTERVPVEGARSELAFSFICFYRGYARKAREKHKRIKSHTLSLSQPVTFVIKILRRVVTKLAVAARSLAQELSEHIRSAILQSSGVLAQCSSGHTHILILVTLLKKRKL